MGIYTDPLGHAVWENAAARSPPLSLASLRPDHPRMLTESSFVNISPMSDP